MASTHTAHHLKVRTIEQKLETLREFTSAYAIAQFFGANGVKGVPGKADRCPIARYLNEGCSVTGQYITLPKQDPDDIGTDFKTTSTAAMRIFIAEFDRKHYSHLIEVR